MMISSVCKLAAASSLLAVAIFTGCNDAPQKMPPASSSAAASSVATTGGETSELAKLPIPVGAKKVFVSGDVAMYSTDASVATTTADCRQRLLDDGWVPYGGAGDSRFYKRGLTRLTATVGEAQGNKTMISYSQEKLTADLPAPSFAEDIQFATTTKELTFQTAKSLDEVISYYLPELATTEWKPTTDQPIKSGIRDELIFRNPGGDMLTLGISEFQERRRVSLRHQSAEQVAAAEKKFREEMAARKAKEEAETPKIDLALPAKAANVARTKGRVNFELPSGGAKEYLDELRKDFKGRGWQERVTTMEKIGGLVEFSKGEQTVTVSYTDPGIVPADVTLLTTGVEIKAPAAK
ncbi:MAG: hypothetical protein QM775_22885 [Pirellulales bacterium]